MGIQYSNYLDLDSILNAQRCLSDDRKPIHDEMLFIITHQVYELWFKQILFEVDSVTKMFSTDRLNDEDLSLVSSRLERVIEIQKLLLDQVGILETMTPMDFLEFRDLLVPASGFQSAQFRILENKLGLRARQEFGDTKYTEHLRKDEKRPVTEAEEEPSLFELVDAWLARVPFLSEKGFEFWKEYQNAVEASFEEEKVSIQENRHLSKDSKKLQLQKLGATISHFRSLFDEKKFELARDHSQPTLSFKGTQAALLVHLYREQPIFQIPYKILSSLVDIDELMTQWRYRHALMARRMIGQKIGTSGSAGYEYLKRSAEKHKVFDDITGLSTYLIPRSKLPKLPESLRRKLGFAYDSSDPERPRPVRLG